MVYRCPECNSILEEKKNVMTEYPIQETLRCGNCHEDYYILVGKILCSETQYRNRVNQYYKPA